MAFNKEAGLAEFRRKYGLKTSDVRRPCSQCGKPTGHWTEQCRECRPKSDFTARVTGRPKNYKATTKK